MNTTITDPLLGLFLTALFFYVLFHVIRAGVAAGIRQSVREDLLTAERGRVGRVPEQGAG